MTQVKIFISGATGNVGTQLVKQLAALNIPFRALVRSGDNADLMSSLPQAEVIIGDLADDRGLIQALNGIDKAFLLTNSSEQAEALQLNFVRAAHKAGVKHVVKLSQFAADEGSPVRFLRYHARVENRIKELGLTYTFLRPNLYMQGLIAFSDYIRKTGKFYAAIGNAVISVVDIRDIASVAAKVLTEEGHENKIYDITGPEAITHHQMADVFTKVLGRQVSFAAISPGQMTGALRAAGFPEWQIDGLIEDYAHYANGEAAEVNDTVQMITNKPATAFGQFVADYKTLFI